MERPPPAGATAPLPSAFAARLAAGAALPFRAAGWLAARPRVWPLALVPAALALAGLVVGLATGAAASRALLSALWAEPAGWTVVLWHAARVALVLVEVLTLALVLPLVLSGPFMDVLSTRVEEAELGAVAGAGGAARFAREAATGLAHALGAALRFYLGLLLLLPALLVPLLWPALAFLWTARWTAVEWTGVPMARHLHGLGETRAALRVVSPMGFGMGLPLAALLLLPLANLVVIPVGTVAGTLLYCELVRAGVVARRG